MDYFTVNYLFHKFLFRRGHVHKNTCTKYKDICTQKQKKYVKQMASKTRVQYILFNVEEFMSYNSKLTESPFFQTI